MIDERRHPAITQITSRISLYLLTCDRVAVGEIYIRLPHPVDSESGPRVKVNPVDRVPSRRTLLKIRRRLLCLPRRRESYLRRGHLLLARMIDRLSSIIVRLR